MANVPTILLLLLSILAITAVLGCGTTPGGLATMSTRTFIITGFSLPVPMAYSTAASVRAQVAGTSRSADAVKAFVMRVVMQAVFNVLEEQGRAAGLPNAIIEIMLGQLTANISYQLLECKDVAVNPDPTQFINVTTMTTPKCIIYGSTVTVVCNATCTLSTGRNVSWIPPTALSISGNLTTTTASWRIGRYRRGKA